MPWRERLGQNRDMIGAGVVCRGGNGCARPHILYEDVAGVRTHTAESSRSKKEREHHAALRLCREGWVAWEDRYCSTLEPQSAEGEGSSSAWILHSAV